MEHHGDPHQRELRIVHAGHRALYPHNLLFLELEVLTELVAHAGLRPFELVDEMRTRLEAPGLADSTLAHVVMRLEDRGFLERIASPAGGGDLILISPQGLTEMSTVFKRLGAVLSPEDLRFFNDLRMDSWLVQHPDAALPSTAYDE